MTWTQRFLWIALVLVCTPGILFAKAYAAKGGDKAAEPATAPDASRFIKAVVLDNKPAIQFLGPYGKAGDIRLIKLGQMKDNGESVLLFSASTFVSNGWRGSWRTTGMLGFTASRIFYQPDPSEDQSKAFVVSRSPNSFIKGTTTLLVDGRPVAVGIDCDLWPEPPDGVHVPKGERKQNEQSIEMVGKVCNNWGKLAEFSFDAAFQKFRAFTANVSVPLTDAQQATLTAKETAGDSAAQAGKLYDALQDYEAAFQALPEQWAPHDIEQRLRQKIIKLVLRMNPAPAIPQEAVQHAAYAQTALQEAKNPGGLQNAITEWRTALRFAPWWADAYYNLGLVLEKANEYEQAADSLQLYLLAKPNAADAQTVQMKIYSLQYQAKQ